MMSLAISTTLDRFPAKQESIDYGRPLRENTERPGAASARGSNDTPSPDRVSLTTSGDEDRRNSATGSYALDSLRQLKDRAKSAAFDLTNSLAVVTNINDRLSILGALREIDPEQAAKFDPPRPLTLSTPPLDESLTTIDPPDR